MADSGFNSEIKRLVDRSGGGAGGVMRLQYLMGAGSSLYVAAMHIHVGGLGSTASQAMARYVPHVRVTGPGTINRPEREPPRLVGGTSGLPGGFGVGVGGVSPQPSGMAAAARRAAAEQAEVQAGQRGRGRLPGFGGPPGERPEGRAPRRLPETTIPEKTPSWLQRTGEAAIKISALGYAAQMTSGFLMNIAQKASPQVVSTFMGSLDMIQARIGRIFLPAINDASRTLQRFSAMLDTAAGKGIIGGVGQAARFTNPATNTEAFLSGGPVKWIMRQGYDLGRGVRSLLGGETEPEFDEQLKKSQSTSAQIARWMLGEDKAMKRSMAGLPQSQVSTAEEYYDRLQTAALNADDIQTDILKQQLDALKEFGGLLEGIQANTAKIGGIIPAFR